MVCHHGWNLSSPRKNWLFESFYGGSLQNAFRPSMGRFSLKYNVFGKNIFGSRAIPQKQKIGVKFIKMIFAEKVPVILRHFRGSLDVKWGCGVRSKSKNVKRKICFP